MTARRSATETPIPLYPIPHGIACQINKQSEDVYRISVKRILWHHYNITVRTKSLKRELRTVRARDPPSRYEPADNSDGVSRHGNSGVAP